MRPSAQGEMEFALPIERPEVPAVNDVEDKPFQRRSVYFQKDDFDKYGYTPGCPGCCPFNLE
eukprot:9385114-Karenia_brevis.AAC.1